MTDHPPYTPPHPTRFEGRLPITELLARARKSFLEIWSAGSFRTEVINTQIIRQRLFLFNMPEAIQSVFVTQAAVFERKSPQMRHALEALLGDGLFISDGLVWKERRRVVQPVTHPSRMSDLTPVMTEVAVEWRDAWGKLPQNAEIDVLNEMGRFTAEVICRAIFGTALATGAGQQVVKSFAAYQSKIGNMDMVSIFGLPDFLPRLQGFWVSGEVRKIHSVVDGLIGDILDGRAGQKSLIAAMAEHSGMSRMAFRNEAITLFMAGHETTANTLAWAWFLLSEATWAEERMLAELDSVLGGREATYEDLDKLPYTRAVVEETLRLYPPVPVLARRASEDTEVAGLQIPRGAVVGASPWLVHRHERHWEAPDEFRPERFLPEATPPAKYTYLPFSLGPRVCTGQHFGLYEAMICLATLAQRFRLRCPPGKTAYPVCRLTLRPGETLPMVLTRR
ncbi:cytochrome P450 [Roseococcus sp. YIM B11640]|uniref:cytochrome P450 n=1 Tax=Roseococcus sp. YIM B11640 TaxID=3133973 RepID=UPI003C7DCA1C